MASLARRARGGFVGLAFELAGVLLISGLIVARYYSRFWYPPDDGNYAHVAERLLSGQVLHRDVQDVHAGYIDFVNAGTFALFGVRLVSMRYPLALITVLQAGLVHLLLRSRGAAVGAVGALAFTALSFVQFLNPTANWYCLFLAVLTVSWLRWAPAGPGRYLGAGFLIGVTFFFRQLSGVLLAMAVVTCLLLEQTAAPARQPPRLARAVILLITAGLGAYLATRTDGVGWLVAGLWPFPVLLHAWRRTTVEDRSLWPILLRLCGGALAAGVPLAAYHVLHRSVGAWWTDSVGTAASLSRFGFTEHPGYTWLAVMAARGLAAGDLAGRVNAVFWLALLLLAPVLGVTLLRGLIRRPADAAPDPLPIVAAFYAVVSLHYQLPIYLFYVTALTLAALLGLTGSAAGAFRIPMLGLGAALALIGVYYQAAMPLSRGLTGIVEGRREPTNTPLALPRGGISVDPEGAARYRSLVALIDRETAPRDTIFAFPSNAELYFLANRTNPFRFYNTALGVRTAPELKEALRELRCRPPRLVFYDPSDKYNTAASARIAALVRASYDTLPSVPPFEIYRRRAEQPTGTADGSCRAGG